jgi:MoxR-like ATPase
MRQYPYYSGQPEASRPDSPVELGTLDIGPLNDAAGYQADSGLVNAVNVALLLGQPLLLTGEPGTGKTQLASSLASELGYGKPLKFVTKSTSTASDLFYTFNALSRFNAAYKGQGSERGLEFVTFNALGLAILLSGTVEEVRGKRIVHEPGAEGRDGPPAPTLRIGDVEHTGPRRSVVLIDEVDKAPRDFPNDLLDEIAEMSFRIPELDNTEVRADRLLRPVVVITSNSEKNLPDAFLRRCVYYDIPFPDDTRLRKIIETRLGPRPGAAPAGGPVEAPAGGPGEAARPIDPEFLADALALFRELRDPGNSLRKRPATAEFLGWISALIAIGGAAVANPLRGDPGRVLGTVNILIKTAADQTSATRIVKAWLDRVGQRPGGVPGPASA